MILGFLGLTFLMVNQFHELSHDLIMVFEFAHVVIFLVAIFFVIHVIIFMLTLRRVKKRWDGTCGMHIDDISDKIIKEGKPDGSYWYRIALGKYTLLAYAVCIVPGDASYSSTRIHRYAHKQVAHVYTLSSPTGRRSRAGERGRVSYHQGPLHRHVWPAAQL